MKLYHLSLPGKRYKKIYISIASSTVSFDPRQHSPIRNHMFLQVLFYSFPSDLRNKPKEIK